MTLKGTWSADITYSVGDVVKFTDGFSYHLQHPCKAGVPPVETRWWGKVSAPVADAVSLILDAMEVMNSALEMLSATIPTNISEDAIVLKSSTPESDKSFIVTVDDDGDLTATEIIEEDAENAEDGET